MNAYRCERVHTGGRFLNLAGVDKADVDPRIEPTRLLLAEHGGARPSPALSSGGCLR